MVGLKRRVKYKLSKYKSTSTNEASRDKDLNGAVRWSKVSFSPESLPRNTYY